MACRGATLAAEAVPPLDTLEYEAEMFFWASAIALDPAQCARVGDGWRNAAAETALLHARNLCRIFFNNGEKGEIKLSEIFNEQNVPFAARRKIRDSIKSFARSTAIETNPTPPRSPST